MRAPYFLCRYVRTEEIKPEGQAFLVVDMPGALRPAFLAAHRLSPGGKPLAPVYVYRLKRVSDALYLTPQEAAAIVEAYQDAETCPLLLSEADAIEGKAL
jgi:hypothetical protein